MEIKIFTFNPFQENTYVLHDETKEALVVDAGCLTAGEQATFRDYIASRGLQVKRVINTHLHLDHQFGNRFMTKTYGILPEAHRLDEFFIDTLLQEAQAFVPTTELVEAQPLGGYIDDNDTVAFGHTELRVLHVPGHSPGSLAFYHEGKGVLFSGDVLFHESVGRTDLPGGDRHTLANSIVGRLYTLPEETVVLPGHGGSTTIGHEKRHNPFVRP